MRSLTRARLDRTRIGFQQACSAYAKAIRRADRARARLIRCRRLEPVDLLEEELLVAAELAAEAAVNEARRAVDAFVIGRSACRSPWLG